MTMTLETMLAWCNEFLETAPDARNVESMRDGIRAAILDRDADRFTASNQTLRAERAEAELAEARKNETVALGLWNAAEGRATKAEAELAALRELHKAVCESAAMNTKELAESRETIKRLNRRVQVAEAGIAEKVKEASGRNLGRALANAAADMFRHERDEALAELAALKRRIAEAVELRVGDPAWSDGTLAELDGQRVALLPVGGE